VKVEDLAFLREHISTLEGQRPERLEEVRDRIRVARRRRATAAGGAAVLAAVGIVLALASQTPDAIVEPSRRPSTDSGGVQVLASDPFLSNRQASEPTGRSDAGDLWMPRIRLPHSKPAPLSRCIGDPRSWGALQTQAATYTDPHPRAHPVFPDPRLNEFLLQYASAAAAHQALTDEYAHVKSCWGGELFPIARPEVRPSEVPFEEFDRFDEAFWGQRGDPAATQRSVVRVARADNVLVVIEDATMDDRSDVLLSVAVRQALPQYK
jgi:hypothetical protein